MNNFIKARLAEKQLSKIESILKKFKEGQPYY
jgi:hypothetical protein